MDRTCVAIGAYTADDLHIFRLAGAMERPAPPTATVARSNDHGPAEMNRYLLQDGAHVIGKATDPDSTGLGQDRAGCPGRGSCRQLAVADCPWGGLRRGIRCRSLVGGRLRHNSEGDCLVLVGNGAGRQKR
jgi:hypothetical protein